MPGPRHRAVNGYASLTEHRPPTAAPGDPLGTQRLASDVVKTVKAGQGDLARPPLPREKGNPALYR